MTVARPAKLGRVKTSRFTVLYADLPDREVTIARTLLIERRKKISVKYYEKPVEMFLPTGRPVDGVKKR